MQGGEFGIEERGEEGRMCGEKKLYYNTWCVGGRSTYICDAICRGENNVCLWVSSKENQGIWFSRQVHIRTG
jgi:hypothetical protein